VVNDDWAGLTEGATIAGGLTIGTDAFGTIQTALDTVSSGNQISVWPGTYCEQVASTSANVTLHGAGRDSQPIIDGDCNTDDIPDAEGPLVHIVHSDFTFDGFQVRNGANNIQVSGMDATIKDCRIRSAFNYTTAEPYYSHGIGILLWGNVDGTLIENNEIFDNDRMGVALGSNSGGDSLDNNTIVGNVIHRNGRGRYLDLVGNYAPEGISMSQTAGSTVQANQIYQHPHPNAPDVDQEGRGIYVRNQDAGVTNTQLRLSLENANSFSANDVNVFVE
jgi:parallel beta-helix repeat protein